MNTQNSCRAIRTLLGTRRIAFALFILTASVVSSPAITNVDLSTYIRVGSYDLPEPTRTTPPDSTNLLCQEASGVAYNWDTDTLFIIGDGGRSFTQVSKTGALIDTMTLALREGAPQGTDFYDPEGVTYIGGGQFVFSEERDQRLVKFTYAAGTVLSRANAQTVQLGTFVPNVGIEGLSYDPQTSGFICVKETSPQGVFQTTVDFGAGTASNSSPTTEGATNNLFNPTLLGFTDLADVFALSMLPALTNLPDSSHLLLLSQEDAKILEVDRAGNIYGALQIVSDLGNPLNVASQQHEGLTMDNHGFLYVVSENGGGDIDHPQLWVYAPATLTNHAPVAVLLTNVIASLGENTSTASPVKLADILVTDDGLGTNVLAVSGTDASSFEITGSELYLKAGTLLDYETKTNYSVVISVDDLSVGTTPDATNIYALTITAANQAPVAVLLTNVITSLPEDTSTASPVKVADILVSDDGLGVNVLAVGGADSSSFQITGSALYLKAGTLLDYETKTNYNVVVSVDDLSIGTTPDATNPYALTITDVTNEFVANLIISEVAPWSSGNSPVGADWFEVSNIGTNPVNITGWKVDDSSATNTLAALLNGVTNIAPGESVIFLETATLAATKAAFLANWFGANVPTNLQVGAYSGTGLGLGTGGDGVCLFDTNGLIVARLNFGASPAGPSFSTFDNAVGINGTNANVARLSTPRTYGSFIAANDPNEIGSPGSIGGLIISEVAAWSSGNSPVGADWFEIINTSPSIINIAGWKVDDGSKLFSAAVALNGVTNIAPGEAVIFLETATLAATKSSFLSNWFGANTPTNLQVGAYTGSGLGLSTGGDGVNLFDGIGTLRASVSFNASPSAAPFTTFDNTFGLNNTTISQPSTLGARGAFVAANSAEEIGSPGLGSKLIISEVAPWASGNSPVAADWFELSNIGATSIDVTGYKMDDNSQSPVGAVALTGVTNIAPGESVIFIETASLLTAKASYLSNWFGTNSPMGLQIGAYTGSGVGLGAGVGGDSVNIYNSNGVLQASVSFGASPTGPYPTFENATGLNIAGITQLSAISSNGAFVAVNSTSEIGSPGVLTVPVLTMTRAGSDALLFWSVEAVGFRLWQASSLAGPLNWTNVAQSPVLTNGQNRVTIPASTSDAFFRLRRP